MLPKRVKSIAIVLGAICTMGVLAIVTLSIQPEPKKPPQLPFADIAGLQPGGFLIVDADRLRYFAVRPPQGEVFVVAVPIENGEVLLPDKHWWKPHRACREFGLDLENGAVSERSRFRCRDATQPEDWSKRWRWDIRGRNVPEAGAERVDDMYRVKTRRVDNRLIFTGLDAD